MDDAHDAWRHGAGVIIDEDEPGALRSALASIGREVERLTVRTRATGVLDAEGSRALLKRLPALNDLTVEGHQVLACVAHPWLERLTVLGHDAVEDLVCPELQTLVYAAHPSTSTRDYVAHLSDDAARFAHRYAMIERLRRWLGAARVLDLSRNEPGQHGGFSLGGRTSAYQLIEGLGGAALVHLILPAPRASADVHALGAFMALNSIRRATIRRLYRGCPDVNVPNVEVGSAVPFRDVDAIHSREALTVTCGAEAEDVALGSLAAALEARWDDLDADLRANATAFIEAYEPLAYPDDGEPDVAWYPVADLKALLAALSPERWGDLTELLRRTTADRARVARYWGW